MLLYVYAASTNLWFTLVNHSKNNHACRYAPSVTNVNFTPFPVCTEPQFSFQHFLECTFKLPVQCMCPMHLMQKLFHKNVDCVITIGALLTAGDISHKASYQHFSTSQCHNCTIVVSPFILPSLKRKYLNISNSSTVCQLLHSG